MDIKVVTNLTCFIGAHWHLSELMLISCSAKKIKQVHILDTNDKVHPTNLHPAQDWGELECLHSWISIFYGMV